jgi:hypothetical protein
MSNKITLSLTITAWADDTTDCSTDYSISNTNAEDLGVHHEDVLYLFCLDYLSKNSATESNFLNERLETYTHLIGQALANEQADDRD